MVAASLIWAELARQKNQDLEGPIVLFNFSVLTNFAAPRVQVTFV